MSPVLDLLLCLALFACLVFGLGLPLVAATPLRGDEKLCAAAAVSLILAYLAAFVIYWTHLPLIVFVVLPAAALLLLALRRRACLTVLRDPAALNLLGSWLLVAGWALGFLCLVRSYSGGGWVLDYLDHYQRTEFFLQHWPAHRLICGDDPLPSRPPLANLVTGVFLALTSADFARFQIFTTLLSSLAFLPGVLFVRRFTPKLPRAAALFTLLFLFNPSVLENSTFAWTKLITVFFVVSGFYFFLQGMETPGRGRLVFGFLLLGAGFLAHYSAGPYLVALTFAYFWWRRRAWFTRAFWIDTGTCAGAGTALLATWFGWSIAVFGLHATVATNTSVTESTVHSLASFIHEKGFNLFATLVPHPLRPGHEALDLFIAQASRLGFIRDYAFMIYQVSLLFLFGSIGGFVLLWLLWRNWRAATRPGDLNRLPRAFWAWFIIAVVVLGVASSGGIDYFGVAHLCLQGLLILGLAFIAARFDTLPRLLRLLYGFGLVADLLLGEALQFYLENVYRPPSGLLPGAIWSSIATLGNTTAANLFIKYHYHLVFAGDWPITRPLIMVFLACLLFLAVVRWRRELPQENGA